MARGWESKSVESQIEDRQNAIVGRKKKKTREEIELGAKRSSLELSRKRIAKELEASRSETHKRALQKALEHLDEELKRL